MIKFLHIFLVFLQILKIEIRKQYTIHKLKIINTKMEQQNINKWDTYGYSYYQVEDIETNNEQEMYEKLKNSYFSNYNNPEVFLKDFYNYCINKLKYVVGYNGDDNLIEYTKKKFDTIRKKRHMDYLEYISYIEELYGLSENNNNQTNFFMNITNNPDYYNDNEKILYYKNPNTLYFIKKNYNNSHNYEKRKLEKAIIETVKLRSNTIPRKIERRKNLEEYNNYLKEKLENNNNDNMEVILVSDLWDMYERIKNLVKIDFENIDFKKDMFVIDYGKLNINIEIEKVKFYKKYICDDRQIYIKYSPKKICYSDDKKYYPDCEYTNINSITPFDIETEKTKTLKLLMYIVNHYREYVKNHEIQFSDIESKFINYDLDKEKIEKHCNDIIYDYVEYLDENTLKEMETMDIYDKIKVINDDIKNQIIEFLISEIRAQEKERENLNMPKWAQEMMYNLSILKI